MMNAECGAKTAFHSSFITHHSALLFSLSAEIVNAAEALDRSPGQGIVCYEYSSRMTEPTYKVLK